MRRTPARTLLVAAALALGLTLLGTAGAADAPTDAEFTALLEQDAKIIQAAAEAGGAAKGPKDKAAKNATNGIKSSALLVATYANDRITGSNAGGDSRAAAVRDQALKVYKAAETGDFKAAGEAAKALPMMKAPGGEAKKVDVIKAVGEVTPKEVMHRGRHPGERQEGDRQAGRRGDHRLPGAGHGGVEQGREEGRERRREEDVGRLQRANDQGGRRPTGRVQEEELGGRPAEGVQRGERPVQRVPR